MLKKKKATTEQHNVMEAIGLCACTLVFQQIGDFPGFTASLSTFSFILGDLGRWPTALYCLARFGKNW